MKKKRNKSRANRRFKKRKKIMSINVSDAVENTPLGNKIIENLIHKVKSFDVEDNGIGNTILHDMLVHNYSLKNIFDMDEKWLEAIYAIGYSQFKQGQFKAAIDFFSVLSCIDHKNCKFLVALGMCHQVQGDYSKAIDTYFKIIDIDASFSLTYIHLCECFFKLSNWNMFIKSLNILDKLEKINELDNKVLYKKYILQSKYEVHHLMKVGPVPPNKLKSNIKAQKINNNKKTVTDWVLNDKSKSVMGLSK